MALPVLLSLQQCADYNTTVAPYLDHLTTLPETFLSSLSSPAALRQLYLDTNPLVAATAFAFTLGPVFLLASEINKNYSQVDRVWSILPSVYNLHFAAYAHLAGIHTSRLDAAFAISALWSVGQAHA
jgi:hypothetical protein